MNNVQDKNARRQPARSRSEQRDRLVGCAERAIAASGLGGLRARDLATCAGCSVGGIYNIVTDMDELVLLVGQRTLSELDAALAGADATSSGDIADQLLAWARAYATFAATHRERWRALFEFRMSTPQDFPEWFATDQLRIFVRLEECLGPYCSALEAGALQARARALFAAVHGIVALGIEGKLVALPPDAIDAELAAFVRTYVAGLRQLGSGQAGDQGVSGSQSSVSSR